MNKHREIMEMLARLESKLERVEDITEGIMDELVPDLCMAINCMEKLGVDLDNSPAS